MKVAIPTEGTRQPRLLGTLAFAVLCTAQLAGAAPELPDIFAYRAQDLIQLRNGFAQPPREAQPWVFWFWWNSVVSRDEIARELEELAAAGFGGAEIRVPAAPRGSTRCRTRSEFQIPAVKKLFPPVRIWRSRSSSH